MKYYIVAGEASGDLHASNLVKALKKKFPDVIISIDTLHAEVAHACINEGAGIINDISGGTFDKNIFAICFTHINLFRGVQSQNSFCRGALFYPQILS